MSARASVLRALVDAGAHLLALDGASKHPVPYDQGGGWAKTAARIKGVYRPGIKNVEQLAAKWTSGEWSPAWRPGTLGIGLIDGDDDRWRELAARWTPAAIIHESDDGAHMLFGHPGGATFTQTDAAVVIENKQFAPGAHHTGRKFDVRGDQGYAKIHSVHDAHVIASFAARVRRGGTVTTMPREFVGADWAPSTIGDGGPSRPHDGKRKYECAGKTGEPDGFLGPEERASVESLDTVKRAADAATTGGYLFGTVRRVARLARWGGAFDADADRAWSAIKDAIGGRTHLLSQAGRGFNAGWHDPRPPTFDDIQFPPTKDLYA